MQPATLADWLPTVNACCNTMASLLIVAGALAIWRRDIPRHKRCMLAAFAFSTLFLIGYLTRYYLAGTTAFQGSGLWRPFYFTILISHMILAAAVVPLVLLSINWGLRGKIDKHKKIVRFTLPIWLYVSVTGVLIYFMLFRWFKT